MVMEARTTATSAESTMVNTSGLTVLKTIEATTTIEAKEAAYKVTVAVMDVEVVEVIKKEAVANNKAIKDMLLDEDLRTLVTMDIIIIRKVNNHRNFRRTTGNHCFFGLQFLE